MNVGEFRHPIVIQELQETGKDDNGNITRAWRDVASTLAAVHDVSGREFYAAAAYQMQDTVTFAMRWQPGIGTHMRIVFCDNPYKIMQINHLGYKRDFITVKARLWESEAKHHGDV